MVTTLVGIGQAILQVKMVVVQHVIFAEHMIQADVQQTVDSQVKDGNINNFKWSLKCVNEMCTKFFYFI